MNGREPYLSAAVRLLEESGCTVRRWRKSTSGVAYTRDDDYGIEAPEPRGPVSYCTFAHEVAHQMLHRARNKPRWLEEVEAWEWALATFHRFELPGHGRALRDVQSCLPFSAVKALRGGSPKTAAAILRRYPSWTWARKPDVFELVYRTAGLHYEGREAE